jgi:hypothetical protein
VLAFAPGLDCDVAQFSQNAVQFMSHFTAKNVRRLFEHLLHRFHIISDVFFKLLTGHGSLMERFIKNIQFFDFGFDFLNLLSIRVKIVFLIKINFGVRFFKFSPELFFEDKSIGLVNTVKKLNKHHPKILNIIGHLIII